MKISGIKIAGKTGTAELKKSSDDIDSGTLGWFNCFTINNLSGNEKVHRTETALDNYNDYDYVIENDGSIEELSIKVEDIIKDII